MNSISFALAVCVCIAVPAHAAPEAPRTAHFHRPDLPHATPAQAPQRIVSLAPVITETLFALGAGAHVVGVTRYCDRPPAALALPQVGGFTDPSLERIVLLRPDLVVAMPSMQQRALLDRLRELGVPVFIVFADALEEALALPSALGDVIGNAAGGLALSRAMRATLSDARLAAPTTLRVLVVVGTDPIFVAGPHSFADDIIRALGATSVVPDSAPSWPQWPNEAVLRAQPDVIVAAQGDVAAQTLRAAFPALRVVSAGRALFMRPGPMLGDDAVACATLLDGVARD